MENHLQPIRAALEASASAEARQAGIDACRALAAALETASPSEPPPPAASPCSASDAPTEAPLSPEELAELCDPREVPPIGPSTTTPIAETPFPETALPLTSPAAPATIGGIDPAALAAIVTTIRSLSPDQWLDLIIDKLKTAVRAMPAAAVPGAPAGIAAFPQTAPPPLRFRLVPVPPAPTAKR
jgi:hypothetical protein